MASGSTITNIIHFASTRSRTNGRTDDEPRAEDVPRGAGLSAIDECQVTTKVVEEYEPAQMGPLLRVVRDSSDHLRHENLGEVGHGLTGFSSAAGRKTNEIWAVDETFTTEVSNARVNTGGSSVHDHDRTSEDATEKGGNGEEDKESLSPNSPWSSPPPPAAPEKTMTKTPRPEAPEEAAAAKEQTSLNGGQLLGGKSAFVEVAVFR